MFLAGADVAEFQTITDGETAAESVRAGQAIMDRIEALPFPMVAAIGGVCLGGGTRRRVPSLYRRENELTLFQS